MAQGDDDGRSAGDTVPPGYVLASRVEAAWIRYAPTAIRRRVEGRPALARVLANVGWLVGDNAFRLVYGVVVGAWVARYLGPSRLGELSYVTSIAFFCAVTSQLGMSAIAVREVARAPQKAGEVLGTVLRLRIGAGVLLWVLSIVAVSVLQPQDRQALLMMAVVGGTVLCSASDTVDLWFQSQIRSRRTVTAKASAYVCSGVLKVSLILAHASLLAFAVVTLVESALAAGALWFIYRRDPAPTRWSWERSWVRRLLPESWPYLVSAVAITIYMRLDQVMLRQMVGQHELGIYSVVIPIATAGYVIPMAVSTSLAPIIAQRKEADPAGYHRAIMRSFTLMWWIMLPITLLIAGTSGYLIRFLYGGAYAASASVLAIHVFANIPVALGVAQGNWLVNERKNVVAMYQAGLGALSNVGLNLWLIPRYGAQGAAMATLVAQVIAAMLSNLVVAPPIFRAQIVSLWGRAE